MLPHKDYNARLIHTRSASGEGLLLGSTKRGHGHLLANQRLSFCLSKTPSPSKSIITTQKSCAAIRPSKHMDMKDTLIYTYLPSQTHKHIYIATHKLATMSNREGSNHQSSSHSGSGSSPGSQAVNNRVSARHVTHRNTELIREHSPPQPTKASTALGPPKQTLVVRQNASKHASLAAVQPCNAGLPR